jgi:hypothetical protein
MLPLVNSIMSSRDQWRSTMLDQWRNEMQLINITYYTVWTLRKRHFDTKEQYCCLWSYVFGTLQIMVNKQIINVWNNMSHLSGGNIGYAWGVSMPFKHNSQSLANNTKHTNIYNKVCILFASTQEALWQICVLTSMTDLSMNVYNSTIYDHSSTKTSEVGSLIVFMFIGTFCYTWRTGYA